MYCKNVLRTRTLNFVEGWYRTEFYTFSFKTFVKQFSLNKSLSGMYAFLEIPAPLRCKNQTTPRPAGRCCLLCKTQLQSAHWDFGNAGINRLPSFCSDIPTNPINVSFWLWRLLSQGNLNQVSSFIWTANLELLLNWYEERNVFIC